MMTLRQTAAIKLTKKNDSNKVDTWDSSPPHLYILCRFPDTMLEAMFSGRHPISRDSQGRCFIDRPPQAFQLILDGLRTDRFKLPSDPDLREMVLGELHFFGLDDKRPFSESLPTTGKVCGLLQGEKGPCCTRQLLPTFAPCHPRVLCYACVSRTAHTVYILPL